MKHELIIDAWYSPELADNSSSCIIPDGCRDLIFSQTKGQQPRWFVSPLFDQAKVVYSAANTTLYGYRLKPGVCIDENSFYKVITDKGLLAVENYMDDFLCLQPSVEEALACLSLHTYSIRQSAAELGVSMRTLQRLILKETGRSPSYWLLLARARRSAKAIVESVSTVEVAHHYGYFDQSHLCREMRRWFGCSPQQLMNMRDMHQQFQDSGYC